jgi:hypothetical protein
MSAAGPTYRDYLRDAVATSAGPHGYTLTLWTSAAVASHSQGGPPGAQNAFLLLLGAVIAFGFIGSFAAGGLGRPIVSVPVQKSLWGALHLPAATISIVMCHLLTLLLHGAALWPAVGFVATASFLLGSALQVRYAAVITRKIPW